MSFAPILDVLDTDRSVQRSRKSARAAAFALRSLADSDETLLKALKLVQGAEASGVAAQTTELQKQFASLLSEVEAGTGVPFEDVLRHLVEQLRQVVDFANLDGGLLDTNVGSVATLIRSGRVELFAGAS